MTRDETVQQESIAVQERASGFEAEGHARRPLRTSQGRHLRTAKESNALDADEVAKRLASDLRSYVAKSGEPRRRIKFLAKKTGVHEKTLQRLMLLQNRPAYMTLFKIYRVLFNENDDAKLLEIIPMEVAQYLCSATPQGVERSKSYSFDIESEMRMNPVLAEIVVLCATGPLKINTVRDRFGDFGMKLVDDLLAKSVLQKVSNSEICEGTVSVNMAPETLTAVGLHIGRSYIRPSKCYETGENHVGFFVEGLSEEAYQEWLRIDAEAFRKKVELSKNPQNRGDIRAFTFSSVDQMLPPKDPK